MQKLMDYCDGIQHIGIPTENLFKTRDFYLDLGFEIAYETSSENASTHVCFLKFNNLVLECYEADQVAKRAGAVDHIAINCTDIDGAYQFALQKEYTIVSNGIESLPFWKKGIRFFIFEGPNKERIEIDQII